MPPVLERQGRPISVSILGTVVDDFGVAVSGASVTVLSDNQPLRTTNVNDSGQFSFPDLAVKVGFHTVRALAMDYRPTDEELRLTHEMDNSSVTLVLRLQPTESSTKIEMPAATFPSEDATATTDDVQYDWSHDQTGTEVQHKWNPDQTGTEVQHNWNLTQTGAWAVKSPDEAKYVQLRVFYATDRNRLLYSNPTKMFGNLRSSDESISFGVCDVSIPNRHQIGEVERPSIFKFQFREDPDKHIILKGCEKWTRDQFYEQVSKAAERSSSRDVFFFIHGYCVTFPEAILRTAQIAFDLDFLGAPVCYSWPSDGRYSGYPADEASVEWTVPHLLEVLRTTAQLTSVRTIHLVAHSMGNRALIRCLEKIAHEFSGASPGARVNQVIMAAPDIDSGVFMQLVETIALVGKRTTLYASSNDTPLVISKQFHNYPRAGEIGEKIVISPRMDTIDVSAVPADIFGHSYYGKSRTVLSDMYELFKSGTAPPRFGLQEAFSADKSYWIFRP